MTLAMSWNEWVSHDAVGLAERVRKGEVSAAQLAKQAAAGVAKVNPALSAVVEVFKDLIQDPLKDGMNPEGPLAGVPFFMKDLGPTLKGRLQEQGSLFMRGNRPTEDAWLTKQMRKAGLNLLGRTTSPEFGVCSSAENPAVYVTRNPWHTDDTTCGSSAGTAASVAAGVLPISHATDGGGLIRIPAGFNGNIGLKPRAACCRSRRICRTSRVMCRARAATAAPCATRPLSSTPAAAARLASSCLIGRRPSPTSS